MKRLIATALCFIMLCGILAAFTGCAADEYPSYIAHRGLSNSLPDNSEAAFLAAVECSGFLGVETDVRYTKDGEFVCAHDEDPFFKSNDRIQDLTAAQVAARSTSRDGNDKLCTMARYLEILKGSGKQAVVELKYGVNAEMTKACLDRILSVMGTDEFMIICFEIDNLDVIAQHYPDVSITYLTNKESDIELCLQKGYDISARYNLATAERVKAFHDAGLTFAVWTVNKNFTKYIDMGVDYITTDKKKD